MCFVTAAALAAGASGFGAGATGAAALGGMTLGTALTVDSMIMGVGSMALQIKGQSDLRKANEARGNYEAAVARNNAVIAENYAKDAEARGNIAAKQQRLLVRQAMGTATTSAAARGVAVGQDTPLKTVEDIAAAGKLDELTIRHNAEREALGFRQQGLNYSASADLAQLRSWTPDTTMATVLAGGSALTDKYLTYKLKTA